MAFRRRFSVLRIPYPAWLIVTVMMITVPLVLWMLGAYETARVPALALTAVWPLVWACSEPQRRGVVTGRKVPTPRAASEPGESWRLRERDEERRRRSRLMRKSPRWMSTAMCRRGSLPK